MQQMIMMVMLELSMLRTSWGVPRGRIVYLGLGSGVFGEENGACACSDGEGSAVSSGKCGD